jgi:hypothetical protein
MACIALHNFALTVERADDFTNDEFFQAGISIMREEQGCQTVEEEGEDEDEDEANEDGDVSVSSSCQLRLLEGKLLCERYKAALFEYLDYSDGNSSDDNTIV